MKQKMLMAALASALALPLASTAFAQNNDSSGASASSAKSAQIKESRNDMRASELMGKNVRNQKGEDLGKVEDVLVNVNSGRVQYTVLSFGGFMGMGDKLFAIPLSAFDRSQQRDHLVLNVSEDRLKNAEGFDKNNWPNYRNDPGFMERVRNAFGGDRSQDETPQGQRNMMRLSEMIGQDVNDRNGKEVGEIEDVVVDMGRGRISYVVLDFDAQGAGNDRLVPIPLSALSAPQKDGDNVALNIDRSRLDQKRGIDRNKWPNLNDQGFQRNMDSYFATVTGAQKTAEQRRQETSGESMTSGSENGSVNRNAEMNRQEEKRATAGSASPAAGREDTSGASGESRREDGKSRSEERSESRRGDAGVTRAERDASEMSGPTQPRSADDTTNRLRQN